MKRWLLLLWLLVPLPVIVWHFGPGQKWLARDRAWVLIRQARQAEVQQNWADAPALAVWRNEAVQQVEESVATVQREPGPDPYQEDWCALASKHLSEGHDQSCNR